MQRRTASTSVALARPTTARSTATRVLRYIPLSDVAAIMDITQRTAQRVVADLIRTGYLHREHEGRQSVYSVRTELPLQVPVARDLDIVALITLLNEEDRANAPAPLRHNVAR